MNRSALLRLLCLGAALWTITARAHDLPLSYIDLHVSDDGIDATIEASAKNFERELPAAPGNGDILPNNQLQRRKPPTRDARTRTTPGAKGSPAAAPIFGKEIGRSASNTLPAVLG